MCDYRIKCMLIHCFSEKSVHSESTLMLIWVCRCSCEQHRALQVFVFSLLLSVCVLSFSMWNTAVLLYKIKDNQIPKNMLTHLQALSLYKSQSTRRFVQVDLLDIPPSTRPRSTINGQRKGPCERTLWKVLHVKTCCWMEFHAEL